MTFAVELKEKAPLLLQSSQLWAVLSELSISEQGRQKGEHLRSFTNFEVKMPELPYIQGLRFSLIDLQGGGAHTCAHSGSHAYSYSTFESLPVLPMISHDYFFHKRAT